MNEIGFNAQKYQHLKELYESYVNQGKDKDFVFVFDGHELLMGYAKYLLEYLKNIFEGGSNG